MTDTRHASNRSAFPDGFLWGGAISSAQADGGFDQDGKGLTTQECRYFDPEWSFERMYHEEAYVSDMTLADFQRAVESTSTENYPFRHGIDFSTRYPEDLQMLGELGLKVFRTSISWARIFPEGDDAEPNAAGIAFYRDLFATIKRNGMKIFATIQHYDIPVALVTRYGGWRNRRLVDLFVRYVEVLFREFGDVVDFWLPFNEINASRFAHWDGASVLIDQVDNMDQVVFQSIHHQFIANAKVVEMSRRMLGRRNIGAMIAAFTIYPATCRPEDVLQSVHDEQYANYFYFDVMARGRYPRYMDALIERLDVRVEMEPGDEVLLAENTVDFLSFSYYASQVASADEDLEVTVGNMSGSVYANPYLEKSDFGWTLDSTGLRVQLNKMYDRYQLPLFVAENGLGAFDVLDEDGGVHDAYRIEYLRRHVEAMRDAIGDGVDLFGYTMWGIIDIVACGPKTMDKRYGVIYVDRDNRGAGSNRRIKKDSFPWYQRCVATNGREL